VAPRGISSLRVRGDAMTADIERSHDRLARPLLPLVVGIVSLVVILYHVRSVVLDGVVGPAGDDFHFYWQAAQRFLADPTTIYEGVHDLRGFLYPPPSIVLFAPFALLPQTVACWLFRAISLAAAVSSVELLARIFEASGVRVRPRDRVLLALIALATGPTYTNMVFGQVNTLVLLDCLAFRWLLERRRPALAGAILALGVWLKVYPILCLLWVVLWERPLYDIRRMLVGYMVAFVSVPALCLPFVPIDLYWIYLIDVLPSTIGRTFQNILNQSLLAAAARTAGPIADYIRWEKCDFSVLPPTWGRIVNVCFALGGVIGIGLWVRRGTQRTRMVGYLCLLSLMPIISPLGWAYVYVLALPALLCAVQSAPRGIVIQTLVLGACAAYFIPATQPLRVVARLPEVLKHLVYDRYPLTATLVGSVIIWRECQASRPFRSERKVSEESPLRRVT